MIINEFQNDLLKFEKSLMGFAYSLTSDKEDAKDLVQETYLKAMKYKEKFTQGSNFKAWVFTILKNTFINNYRHSQHYYKTFSDLTKEPGHLSNLTASTSANPDSVFRLNEIEKIIETLDDNFKQPFKLHYEGFKYREIAEKLDLNIGTVKSRIFLTRKKLIKKLEGQFL